MLSFIKGDLVANTLANTAQFFIVDHSYVISLTPQSPVTRQQLSHNIKDAVEKAAFSGAGSFFCLYLNTLESQFALFVCYILDLCDANPGRLLVSLYLSVSV